MIDTEILEDYSSEARELLDEMDHNLIRLEKEGDSPELLNNIFRAVHCIKGSAEYIGLERSSTLTHGVENLLDRLREGLADLTPALVDFLFRVKDLISTLIGEVSQHQMEKSEISAIMEELDRFLEEVPDQDTAPEPAVTTSQISEEAQSYIESITAEIEPSVGEVVTEESIAQRLEEDASEEWMEEMEEGTEEVPEALPEIPPPYLQHAPEIDGEVPSSEMLDEFTADSPEETTAGGTERFLDESHEVQEPSPIPAVHEVEAADTTLEGTIPTILSISLYLDDLQDDLNADEAISSTIGRLRALKEYAESIHNSEMQTVVETMESQLRAIDPSTGPVTLEDVERLRSLLNDLRPFYPEEAFPPSPRIAPTPEATEVGPEGEVPVVRPGEDLPVEPSPFARELEKVPGMHKSVVEAILAEGFSSMQDVATAELSSLTGIAGVDTKLANALYAAAGVSQPVPKPTSPQPREERSLLADVDDELLREFEGIFGEEEMAGKPVPAGALPAQSGRAEALLEEWDVTGADADREIMEIFLSYGWEILDKLRPIVRLIADGKVSPPELDHAADLIKSIRSSSTYMDYQNLASFLDEWYEKTLWIQQQGASLSPADLAFMEESFLRFQDFLTGLDAALTPANDAQRAASHPGVTDQMPSPPPSGQEQHGADRREFPVSSTELPETGKPEASRYGPGVVSAYDEPSLKETPSRDLRVASQQAVPGSEPPLEEHVPREDAQTGKALTGQLGPATEFPQEGPLVKTMRVDSSKVDVLLNQVGELVVNRSYVEQLSVELKELQRMLVATAQVGKREIAAIKDINLKVSEASLSLGRVATDIQEGVMKLRMLPVGQLFNRMPRLIRDLSRRVGKTVNLEVYGGDTEVDKRVIEQIYNPLVHLIRNAVDHGIEDRDFRKRIGKSEEGSIALRAYSEGNQVVIDVEDDGGGINKDSVLRRAVENRLVDAQDIKNVSKQEVYNFLFLPGFSTSDKVTRTSGRGVGMDVVKKDVEKISGHIEIESWENVGTRVSIKIPLTLAIIQTLLIKSGNHVFAIPLTSVREIIHVSTYDIETIEGFEVIRFRDETIPVLRIAEVFNLTNQGSDNAARFLVLATAGLKTVGFLVEELVGEQDVVIKPLAEHVCEIRGLAGSTILGDGTIALVMDVTEIVDDIIFQQRQIGIQGF